MTIQLELSATGGQLGRALARDPEEFGYALLAIVEEDVADLGPDATLALTGTEIEIVAEFLERLAAQFRAAV
jgi:hypothetical protein